jgi:hypothetical protein
MPFSALVNCAAVTGVTPQTPAPGRSTSSANPAQKQKPEALQLRAPIFQAWILQNLYVLCLPAFGATLDIELHGLTFLEAAETVRLNCRMMDEYVLAILTADEAKTLGVVKPLHCSLFHFLFYLLFLLISICFC